MKIQRKTIYETCQTLINILVAVLMCSFTVLSTYGWGSYIMIACMMLILGLDIFRQGMRYRFKISPYIMFMIAFCGYTLVSSLIAIDPSDSVTNAVTLFEMILMIFVLEQVYSRQENGVATLLTILKWTAYIIVIYTILFYGIDTLMYMATEGQRMDNRYANVNLIGMLAAVGVVVQVDEMLREKTFKLAAIFCVPAVLLLAITQSRKALLLLVLGVIMVVLMHSKGGNRLHSLLKFLGAVIVILIALKVLSSLEIFGGILERFNDMVAGVLGFDEGGASTSLRLQMIDVGWQQFFRTPLFGVGIGNAHHIAARELGFDVYLHNNFIELLVGGGLVGFVIYYAMYASLLISFFKYRKCQNSLYIVCLTLTLLMLMMDYGRVTYYDKMNYIYLLIFFMETAALKKEAKGRSTANETEKTV